MRFFQAAVLALFFGAVAFSGVDARKKHHGPLYSATSPSVDELQDMFTAYIKQFGKKYSHEEFATRFANFRTNVEKIRIHNTQRKDATYTMGLNQFSDLTAAEFKSKYYGYKPIKNDFLRSKNYHKVDENVKLPAAVDWRTKNAVTPVKNQGQCGSCWAFSTTGSTEGAWAIAKGELVSLSEEQLVDCSSAQGNQGCQGGLMDQGFEYIIQNHGICSEASYPYVSAGGTSPGTCSASSCTSVATISSYTDVPANNEAALLSAAAGQPVSVAIEADQSVFQSYTGGIINDPSCGTTLDHGVLVVGYGTDNGQDYWIVKNSWGASWGESGYVRLARNVNQCGISQQPSYPTV